MRKFFALLTLLSITAIGFAQQPKSHRMILMEEFSNASCGPCAATNPGFNALLDANANKVIPIKYQWDFPGFDPMNQQNPTEVDVRISYYSINSVPKAVMDGTLNTHPSNINQTTINNESVVPSPFVMTLTHYLSDDKDSIFIKCVFEATEAITMTTPKCHVAITEQEIHFTSAPGANGEKDFFEVMRKMLPNASGTSIATNWTIGEKDSLMFAVALPAYIYDLTEVAVVSWIQDNANKSVKQAAYSMPIPFEIDGSLVKLSNISFLQCDTTITPKILIKNKGSKQLTKLNIHYKIDNNTVDSIIWNSALSLLDTTSITLPPLTSTEGSHDFTAYIFRANDTIDNSPKTDTVKAKIHILGTYNPIPLTEGFQGSVFPPANFIINNASNDAYTWQKATVGAWGTSNASAKLMFYYISSGYDELFCTPLNFSSLTSFGLTFDVAYARYSNSYSDKLEVFISTNCGDSWTSIYNKSGSTLATAPNKTSSFVPSASQWRNEFVNLSTYAGQSEVLIKFKGTSGYGNNLYIDNINITVEAGIETSNMDAEIAIYPNPANDIINISNAENAFLEVYDLMGKLILSEENINLNHSIDVSGFAKGSYIIRIVKEDKVFSSKITILK